MQRHLDPKGLQEMVHVSCLEEGQEPVVAQNAGPRARLSDHYTSCLLVPSFYNLQWRQDLVSFHDTGLPKLQFDLL